MPHCQPFALAFFAVSVPGAALTFPLYTSGRYIKDADGHRVKLVCVNWYGGQLKSFVQNGLSAINAEDHAANISKMGFNCARLPYSTEAYFTNPPIRPAYISALSNTTNRTFIDVLDEVVSALTAQKIMVILNNHNTNPGWCCHTDDQGIWFNDDYNETMWVESLRAMAERYVNNPFVVGFDLRNEVRPDLVNKRVPVWGDAPAAAFGYTFHDWRDAAELAGAAVLSADPNALIIVEMNMGGALMCSWMLDLYPIRNLDGHVVWSSHEYNGNDKYLSFFAEQCKTPRSTVDFLVDLLYLEISPYNIVDNYSMYVYTRNMSWGHIADTGYGPMFVGEFGGQTQTTWWNWTIDYLNSTDVGFAYWAYDGEKFPYAAIAFGEVDNPDKYNETYGLVLSDYVTASNGWKIPELGSLALARLGNLPTDGIDEATLTHDTFFGLQGLASFICACVAFILASIACILACIACISHSKEAKRNSTTSAAVWDGEPVE